MNARALASIGIVALFALTLAWQLVWLPPRTMPAWLAAALHASPLLPAIALLVRRRASASFWGALAALILFCHGISEAWSSVAARGPASAEIALSLWVVIAASWDGLRARFAKRSAAPRRPL